MIIMQFLAIDQYPYGTEHNYVFYSLLKSICAIETIYWETLSDIFNQEPPTSFRYLYLNPLSSIKTLEGDSFTRIAKEVNEIQPNIQFTTLKA